MSTKIGDYIIISFETEKNNIFALGKVNRIYEDGGCGIVIVTRLPGSGNLWATLNSIEVEDSWILLNLSQTGENINDIQSLNKEEIKQKYPELFI